MSEDTGYPRVAMHAGERFKYENGSFFFSHRTNAYLCGWGPWSIREDSTVPSQVKGMLYQTLYDTKIESPNPVEAFKKNDKGKPQYHLLSPKALHEVVKVLTHGAEKYGAENWRNVKGSERYWDAAQRHLHAFRVDEVKDPDSGLSHLAHAICSLLFLLELELEGEEE